MDEKDLNPLSVGLPDASIIKPQAQMNNEVINEQRVKPVVSQPTVLRKKPWWRRAKESIFFEDGKDIGGYILTDVILPAVRDTIYDMVTGGISMALYSTPKAGRGRGKRNGQIVSYDGYYSNDKTRPRFERADKYRTQLDIYNIPLEDDPETGRRASDVGYGALEELGECMRIYNFVRVQDLADALNIGNIPSTMCNWGWDDISNARIELDHGQWYFRMHSKAIHK